METEANTLIKTIKGGPRGGYVSTFKVPKGHKLRYFNLDFHHIRMELRDILSQMRTLKNNF